MRRFSLLPSTLLAACLVLAACGRSDKTADSTAAQNDTAAAAGATGTGARALTATSPTSDPPPPRIDTSATMYLDGAAAAATIDDSSLVNFSYDTAGTGFKATFSTRDSTTADGATLTGSGSTISGTGKITAKLRNGTVVVDLSKGIAPNSNMGRCANPAGQGRCGRVTFDSAQFTPKSGRAQTRKVRLDLGH